MEGSARLLPRVCGGAAALVLGVLLLPRFGAVYVGGSSMRPACVAGDLALYRRGGARATERDIVVFAREDGTRVLHRVTAIMLDGRLRTRGDANLSPDPGLVTLSDVEGVVVAVVPCGKALDSMAAGVRWCYNHVPIANTRR